MTQSQSQSQLQVSGSPHIGTHRSIKGAMITVICALIPALVCSIYFFGWRAAAVVAVTIASCMISEYLITRFMMGRKATITDCSALLTGLLLGMSLPSTLPYPIAAIGGVFAIGVGKMAFGGLGQNIFNPALVGRVFLLISFPVDMTTWPLPLYDGNTGATGSTGATILSSIKESGFDSSSIDIAQMAIGNMGGSLGEIGSIALVAGGVYLIIRGIIKWHIPVSILAVAAIASAISGENPAIELLSGGMILGAVFMATDYVTSPMTKKGMLIYGAMIGLITFIIRHYGSYPEGISFAILIMNGCTPLINRWTKPRIFGERRHS